MQVGRIFTAISISSGNGSRQFSTRYAFHAGRNLPGKGLRYLRTLRVRAVVHWSLRQNLFRYLSKSASIPAINLPAPDRPQLLYVSYSDLQEPVFLLNSRLKNINCGPDKSGQSISKNLRSAFLPSSLNHPYPNALVYSTCSPVSVCGTDNI